MMRTPSVRRTYEDMCVIGWVNVLGMGVRSTPCKILFFNKTAAYCGRTLGFKQVKKSQMPIDRRTPHKTKSWTKNMELDKIQEIGRTPSVRH